MSEQQIYDLTRRVEIAINKTPSGELRNLLTDINIALQTSKQE